VTGLAVAAVASALIVFGALIPFALHRGMLLWRARAAAPSRAEAARELSVVTVQLPVFNEANVVERLIDAACSLDYPKHLLEVQVLDDSTDETVELAAARVEHWRAQGVDVTQLRRPGRQGFKAGALGYGLARARGRYVLILDADFVAPPDLIRRLLPPFGDPTTGMVQARWAHLNADASLLTRGQAALLDAHFSIEHVARYASDCFFNFNGTAGMWRAQALEDAGGWECDTLTEDLDISYRAQLAGWRFVYLDDCAVPAELPDTLAALQVQQRRWAQGGVQTARKLLPAVWRSDQPGRVKREATMHLLAHLTHPLTLLLALLLFPALWARRTLGLPHTPWGDLMAFVVATLPFCVFYGAAARRRGRGAVGSAITALITGIGLSAPLSRAALRGLFVNEDPFLRTPKRGSGKVTSYRERVPLREGLLSTAVFGWLLFSITWATVWKEWSSLPFLVLFAVGHGWFGWLGLGGLRTGQVPSEQESERKPDQDSDRDGERPLSGTLELVESPVRKKNEAA